VNFGVLPLELADPDDRERLSPDDVLVIEDLREAVRSGDPIEVQVRGGPTLHATHHLSDRQVEVLLAGGLIHWIRDRG